MDNNDKEKFLEALLKGDRKGGSAIAKKYVESHSDIKNFYENIIKPSLYKVGEMWEYNIISVAAEHLATAVSESIMNELYEHVISENRSPYKIVLGCIEKEQHQVGVKMIADVFEMHGWDAFFLGANTPNADFIDYIREIEPDLIGLSLSIYSHMPSFEELIKNVRNEFPNKPIIVGGQAFTHGGEELIRAHYNIILLRNLSETEQYIKHFEDEHKR
ncbi:MAG: cobalamin B12-binding domain-containing protein [Prolixibacteraceae bacterium]|nr:cobalamin B12-binding domain-containing protein [Prolixibacteraceae bacterium]MBN2650399.1 cobalamin B12-binding domain-containing protein [Prolixibacteraceae bacterium]